jgi:hypothetical protein
MANKNQYAKLTLIGAMAASAMNCVIVSRETGIVALATARQSGNDNPSHFLVSSALVGTGDNFKLWQGVELAVERASNGEGLIYRCSPANPDDVLSQYVQENSDVMYPDAEIFVFDTLRGIGKMKKAFKEWDGMMEWAQKEYTDNFGAPRMAESVAESKDAAWPFPTGSKPQ